eukprot:g40347.t1
MLYTRYIDEIFFLWTHGEESLKRLHSDINKFHPTIKLTMDYFSESVSFLDTCLSIKDGHFMTSLYRKPTDNLTMLHFSSYHPKCIKEAIPYGQALKKRNYLLRRQTQDMTDRVPFIIQYFPGAERLHRVRHSLELVFNHDEYLAKINPTPPLLILKQSPNLKQTTVRSKLPSLQENSDHNTIQPCHGNLCKTCQIINMDTTITR